MTEVDRDKLDRVMLDWIEHEHWIQNGCPNAPTHKLRVPGYIEVARQNLEAYDFYRHALVPYFAAARGFPGLHGDLIRFVDAAKQKYPESASLLLSEYVEPGARFRAQWGNLFDTCLHSGLTHDSLHQYQRKFEVELPLRLLANIRELITNGTFDPNLSRFRDHSGNLKKGVIARYIQDGLKEYPKLASAAKIAYDSKLRNTIAHNEYTIENNRFRPLDGRPDMSAAQFEHRLEALQVLQNAVIWLFMSRYDSDRASLEQSGVVAIGWGWDGHRELAHLSVFQLNPFFSLDREVQWLDQVRLRRIGDKLITKLGDAPAIEGPILSELEPILDAVRQSGHVRCSVIPIMPCIHQHSPDVISYGAFCEAADGVTGVAPAEVVA